MVDFPDFDAPIAGESLTAELGSRPWQSPPQFAKVEDVIGFYTEKLLDPKVSSDVVVALDNDIPISVLVNSMMLGSVMEGIHTIDVGVIVTPLLIELCEFIANEAEIKYTTGLEEEDDDSVIDSVVGKKAIKQFKEQSGEDNQEPTPSKEPAPESKGLMARPTQEPEGVM
tara:strand:- start:693 stop:1202 length:510 start_codon:yes stop_codon:yes gene_type:complete